MTIPNALSWSRIWAAFILPIIFLFSRPPLPGSLTISGIAGAFLVILVFLTDWLDGYVARKRNQQTEFGAKLDHIADKVLISSLSLYFWLVEPGLPAIFVLPLLAREWLIVFLRSQTSIPVKNIGKYKVWAQGIAFTLLAAGFYTLGSLAYFIALILAYWSAYLYIRQAMAKTT